MEPYRAAAYRHLLYWAMLDIRRLSSIRLGSKWWNPFRRTMLVRESIRAGEIADWLHNLALFSQADFDGFNEDRFWNEYEWYRQRNPDFDSYGYRDQFERFMRENLESHG
jgi:hypothetical protein